MSVEKNIYLLNYNGLSGKEGHCLIIIFPELIIFPEYGGGTMVSYCSQRRGVQGKEGEGCGSMVRVALLKVDNYQEKLVRESMVTALSLLGITEDFFHGKKVLLKPNFLAASPVEKAVCSHPAVVGGIASVVKEMKGRVEVGDSPGFGSVFKVAESCGVAAPLRELNVPLVSLEDGIQASFPQGEVCKAFTLGRRVKEVDKIISVARLKTHNLTKYTGAVKNLYGCISGRHKASLHLRYNQVELFSRMLADLLGAVRPDLSLVDGIVSMEGPGPRKGNPRFTGFIVMSQDAVAADVVACKTVGINPEEVLHLKYAGEKGWGEKDLKNIEIVGDKEESIQVKGFKKADSHSPMTGPVPSFLVRFLRNYFVPLPEIIPGKCQSCGICAHSCPPGIIEVKKDRVAEIDMRGCIRCYCCQELCPHEAVTLKRRWVFK